MPTTQFYWTRLDTGLRVVVGSRAAIDRFVKRALARAAACKQQRVRLFFPVTQVDTDQLPRQARDKHTERGQPLTPTGHSFVARTWRRHECKPLRILTVRLVAAHIHVRNAAEGRVGSIASFQDLPAHAASNIGSLAVRGSLNVTRARIAGGEQDTKPIKTQ